MGGCQTVQKDEQQAYTIRYDGCIIAATDSLWWEDARLDKRLRNTVIYTIRYDGCIIALVG